MEEGICTHSQNPGATSQPSLFTHTHSLTAHLTQKRRTAFAGARWDVGPDKHAKRINKVRHAWCALVSAM